MLIVIKYIKSPAILTTSQFNLVYISSNLILVLYIIGHNVLNLTGNEIRDLFRVFH